MSGIVHIEKKDNTVEIIYKDSRGNLEKLAMEEKHIEAINTL